MVWWLRWHCPPDTGFEIRALAVWGRARYLSVTEAPHNTDFHTWMGKKHFVSFKPPRPGTEPRTLAWKAAVLTTTLGPPPYSQSGILRHWLNAGLVLAHRLRLRASMTPTFGQCLMFSDICHSFPTVGPPWAHPNKHMVLTECSINFGTPFATLSQHWSNNGRMYRVF